jgi:hypothetical protein
VTHRRRRLAKATAFGRFGTTKVRNSSGSYSTDSSRSPSRHVFSPDRRHASTSEPVAHSGSFRSKGCTIAPRPDRSVSGCRCCGRSFHCRPSRATPRDEDEAGANEREDGDDAQDRPDGAAGRRESRRVRCGRWAHRGRRRAVVLGAATSTRTRMRIWLRRFRNPGTSPPSGFRRTTASALCRGRPNQSPTALGGKPSSTTAATRSAAARIRAAKCNRDPQARGIQSVVPGRGRASVLGRWSSSVRLALVVNVVVVPALAYVAAEPPDHLFSRRTFRPHPPWVRTPKA